MHQAPLSRLLSCRCPCLYGHVVWLGEDTPVNKSPRLHIVDLLTACAGDVHLADHGTNGSANLETSLTVPSETSAFDRVMQRRDDLGRLRDNEDDDDDRSRDTAIKATFHHDPCKNVCVWSLECVKFGNF